MITKEEFEKAVNCCTGFIASCENCPLSKKDFKCGVYLAEYLKENEPAPEATGTSSQVSVKEDTDNIHFDDSILLDICQEGLYKVTQTSNTDYQIGYADAVLDIIKKLKGGDGNG